MFILGHECLTFWSYMFKFERNAHCRTLMPNELIVNVQRWEKAAWRPAASWRRQYLQTRYDERVTHAACSEKVLAIQYIVVQYRYKCAIFNISVISYYLVGLTHNLGFIYSFASARSIVYSYIRQSFHQENKRRHQRRHTRTRQVLLHATKLINKLLRLTR